MVIWVLIVLGGAAGGLSRYTVSGIVQRRTKGSFPTGTMTVNVTGALVAGFVVGLVASRGFDDSAVGWLTTGFLGGFTTFSTWMVETDLAAADGGRAGLRRAAANVVIPLVAGVTLAAVAYRLGFWF